MKTKLFVFVLVVALALSACGLTGSSSKILLEGGYLYGFQTQPARKDTTPKYVPGTPLMGFRFAGQEKNGMLLFQDQSNPQILELNEAGWSNFLPYAETYFKTFGMEGAKEGTDTTEKVFVRTGQAYLLEQEWERALSDMDTGNFNGVEGLTLSRIGDTKPIMSIDFKGKDWAGKKISFLADPESTNLAQIVLTEGVEGNSRLEIYNPQTGVTPLSPFGNSQGDPSFSPDGKEVVYKTDTWTASSCVRRKNIETGEDIPLYCGTEEIQIGNEYPKWSPDGKFVAIALNNLWRSSDTASFVIVDESGKFVAALTLPQYSLYCDMAWSPDGNHLAVLTWQTGEADADYEQMDIFDLEGKHLNTFRYKFPDAPNYIYWIK